MSKRSKKTTEAERVWGRRQRLRRCNDEPDELVTTTEALAEEDEPKVSTTTTEDLTEEAEETTRPSERLRRQRQRCVYGFRVLMTTAEALEE